MASVDMTTVDGNAWYWITEWRVNWTSGFTYNGNGDLYFAAANNESLSNGMQWQIYELPDRRFQFRSRNSNTNKQLGVCYDAEEKSSSLTQPCMEEATAEESQQWKIEPWGDGSYKILNVANGTDLNLDWHPGGPGFMSPDTAITPIQPAQHWVFSSVGAVQDGLYSTSIQPESTTASPSASATGTSIPASASASATGASAGAASTSSTAPNTQQSSGGGGGGLSGGAAAGIGVGVALGVIAFAALAFFLVRRKRRQPKNVDTMQELPGTSSGAAAYGNAVPGKTYEKNAPVYEAPANGQAYEMATPPSELPGGHEYRR